MTTLTDAELFCLRHLEREGQSSGLTLCCTLKKHLGDDFQLQVGLRSIRGLHEKRLTVVSMHNGHWRHTIAPAGCAELEQQEGEDG